MFQVSSECQSRLVRVLTLVVCVAHSPWSSALLFLLPGISSAIAFWITASVSSRCASQGCVSCLPLNLSFLLSTRFFFLSQPPRIFQAGFRGPQREGPEIVVSPADMA
ncbi:hypothetical protein LX32DRAFT_258197 [Colletotrichum zoysiae]|uniref:Uncharacterized protein n=1 Tax=Colletotrichum zoysiae TaxID=1216348 RepID=A0AAD9H2X4_9PEZI|nr:hypothetical protein LX32DRAFT_258197 [Colletotrichum zoysiae]